MRHRPMAMVFSAVILLGTGILFVLIPKGFIPSTDTGAVFGNIEAQAGISFEGMAERMNQVAAVARQNPNVAGVMVSSGGGGPFGGSGNQGRITVYFKPHGERSQDADAILRNLNPRFARIPGVRVFLNNPPAVRVGGRGSNSQYQFTLQSSDLDELYKYSAIMEDRMKEVPHVTSVSTDLQLRNPQLRIEVDRDRAASLGLGVDQVNSALYNAYGSRQISSILGNNNDYPVMLELLEEFQRDPAAINLLHVRARNGNLIPLGAVSKVVPVMGPVSVNHTGQMPSVTLSFNLQDGASLGEGVAAVSRLAAQVLPQSISTSFGGTAAAFQQSQSGLAFLLVVAILVIYLVLGVLYESFIHPITILSGLPFAVFGALLALLIFKTDLNIYSYVGLVLLVGLVKKNAIMMIDFALDAQRKEGKDAAAAAVEACLVRFRPIMMTTMCALMGTLPIAIGLGSSGASRRPLGIAVVGGLLFSQIITLYVTPVFYTYMDGLQHWAEKRFRRRKQAPSAEPVFGAAD
jgi:HAE1 family hydrophobic/amphiphilic exporter-1